MPTDTPIACTLTGDELPERLSAARELGEKALVGLEVFDRRAVLRFSGERERVDALVAAENKCCSFFEFEVDEDAERIELRIATPEGGQLPMRSLVAGVVAGWEGGL